MSIVEPRTSVVTIYQGDDLDRIRHIERQYDAAVEAEKKAVTRTADEIPESMTLAEQHRAETEKAEARALHVKVRAVRRSRYRELADQHKPRSGEDVDPNVALSDANMKVNEETFRLVLVPEAIVDITTADGEVTTWADLPEGEREDFLDTITESDFELLFLHAFGLVNNFASAPKALKLPASQMSTESGAN